MGTDRSETGELGVFASERALLFSIAYRMLGSASDAEDVLQDAWLRGQGVDPSTIRSPIAWATTVVTRLCLDRLKSARHTREQYVGPWLPEPVLTADVVTPRLSAGASGAAAASTVGTAMEAVMSTAADAGASPETLLERSESVTLAFLALIEKLSPEERAVFLLREVFDYDHAEVAQMLDISVESSRQLAHQAKSSLRSERPRPRVRGAITNPAVARRVAERFAKAFAAGDAETLTSLLTADVDLLSDGGGKVPAAGRPILGRDAVVSLLVGLRTVAGRQDLVRHAALEFADINEEPAMIIRVHGRIESVFVFSLNDAGSIASIQVARNPDKLAHLERRLAV